MCCGVVTRFTVSTTGEGCCSCGCGCGCGCSCCEYTTCCCDGTSWYSWTSSGCGCGRALCDLREMACEILGDGTSHRRGVLGPGVFVVTVCCRMTVSAGLLCANVVVGGETTWTGTGTGTDTWKGWTG